MYSHPEVVLDQWLNGVNSGNLNGVLDLYAEEAVLMPTFSNQIRTTREEIANYFQMVAQNGTVIVEVVQDSLVVQPLSGQSYSLVGVYNWTLGSGANERHFRVRFTFTVDLGREQPIVHHHSSAFPEPAS
ncbi:MAG: nuclear transport factor 2 family protein [Opitutales bacterium]